MGDILPGVADNRSADSPLAVAAAGNRNTDSSRYRGNTRERAASSQRKRRNSSQTGHSRQPARSTPSTRCGEISSWHHHLCLLRRWRKRCPLDRGGRGRGSSGWGVARRLAWLRLRCRGVKIRIERRIGVSPWVRVISGIRIPSPRIGIVVTSGQSRRAYQRNQQRPPQASMSSRWRPHSRSANAGRRFSRKARTPSAKSPVAAQAAKLSVSRRS